MGAVRPVNITLSEDLAAKLDDAAASGGYDTISDLIGDLLHDWEDARDDRPEDTAHVRQLIEQGLASGEGGDVTEDWFEEIKRRGRVQSASPRRPI